MKRRPNKEAREKLATNIEAALRCRPYTILELAEAFGFSHHAVRVRLRQLLAAGRAYYIEVPSKGNLGMSHVWKFGLPSQEQVQHVAQLQRARELQAAAPSIERPKQETIRQYPPIGRRDPLVVALFGPAQRRHA